MNNRTVSSEAGPGVFCAAVRRNILRLLAIITTASASGCRTTENKKIEDMTAMHETIELTVPAPCGGTLLDALEKRKSVREYSDRMPSLEQVSGVLWAACGMNRPDSGKRTAPSALALYPVLSGDSRTVTGLQDFVFSAPLNLLYVADMDVFQDYDMPADKKFVLASMDAAGYAQNVNLYCAACGMASVTRASFPAEEALSALGLDTRRFAAVLAQTVGFER